LQRQIEDRRIWKKKRKRKKEHWWWLRLELIQMKLISSISLQRYEIHVYGMKERAQGKEKRGMKEEGKEKRGMKEKEKERQLVEGGAHIATCHFFIWV
jgi:hypothetical protein